MDGVFIIKHELNDIVYFLSKIFKFGKKKKIKKQLWSSNFLCNY